MSIDTQPQFKTNVRAKGSAGFSRLSIDALLGCDQLNGSGDRINQIILPRFAAHRGRRKEPAISYKRITSPLSISLEFACGYTHA